MTANATGLLTSVKTRTASVLGATWSELPYAQNVAKNSFKSGFKKYGLLAKSQTETTSVTRSVTIDQNFELILVDSFINTAMSDSNEQAKGPALQDLAYDVYRDLVSTRCGANASVLLVSNFATNDPETLPESDVVVVRATFTIKYRALI